MKNNIGRGLRLEDMGTASLCSGASSKAIAQDQRMSGIPISIGSRRTLQLLDLFLGVKRLFDLPEDASEEEQRCSVPVCGRLS